MNRIGGAAIIAPLLVVIACSGGSPSSSPPSSNTTSTDTYAGTGHAVEYRVVGTVGDTLTIGYGDGQGQTHVVTPKHSRWSVTVSMPSGTQYSLTARQTGALRDPLACGVSVDDKMLNDVHSFHSCLAGGTVRR